MTQDQSKAIVFIIPLIVKNNAGKVAIALKDAGYSKDFIPDGELEARLFQLYISNPDNFFQLMRSIPWNLGQKDTNLPETKDELIKLVTANTDTQISKDNWWPELITLLQKESHEPDGKYMSVSFRIGFLLILTGIAIAVALYAIFKN